MVNINVSCFVLRSPCLLYPTPGHLFVYDLHIMVDIIKKPK